VNGKLAGQDTHAPGGVAGFPADFRFSRRAIKRDVLSGKVTIQASLKNQSTTLSPAVDFTRISRISTDFSDFCFLPFMQFVQIRAIRVNFVVSVKLEKEHLNGYVRKGNLFAAGPNGLNCGLGNAKCLPCS